MRFRSIAIIGILIAGLVFSGCTKEASESQQPGEDQTASLPQVELGDADLAEIESDLNDLDSFISDIEEIDLLDISDLDPEDL